MSYVARTAPAPAPAFENGCMPPNAMPSDGPRPSQLPRSRRVMLLIDFINPLDFPGADRLAGPAVAAARATAKLKERLARDQVVAVYANDNYGIWQSDFHTMVSTCLGLEGATGDIARLLYPQASDLTILKPRHSAFYASPLELLLAEMQARELVICGLATDMCVQLTAMDAFLREFKAWGAGRLHRGRDAAGQGRQPGVHGIGPEMRHPARTGARSFAQGRQEKARCLTWPPSSSSPWTPPSWCCAAR
jgi:nicotinamidase-related amidase